MADVLGKKISELAETTDLAGLYTIGSDKDNQSKKVSLQFVKEAADYANAQGDYAKGVGDTLQGNTGVDEYPVFSASTQYAAGSVVLYNNKLYRFTALHPAGAWVGTDAVETSIKAETDVKLTELESEVSEKSMGAVIGGAKNFMVSPYFVANATTLMDISETDKYRAFTVYIPAGVEELGLYNASAATNLYYKYSKPNIGDTIDGVASVESIGTTKTYKFSNPNGLYAIIALNTTLGSVSDVELRAPWLSVVEDVETCLSAIYYESEEDKTDMIDAVDVGRVYVTNSVGSTYAEASYATMKGLVIDVVKGDSYIIKGRGGNTYRLWAKALNGVILENQTYTTDVETKEIICDGSFDQIVVNVVLSIEHSLLYLEKAKVNDEIAKVNDEIAKVNDEIASLGASAKGKTVILLGDSQVGQETEFEKLLSQMLPIKAVNCGFAGCRMALRTDDASSPYDAFSATAVTDTLVSRDFAAMDSALATLESEYPYYYKQFAPRVEALKGVTLGDGDNCIMTIAYGSNDYSGGNDIGEAASLNKKTLLGAMQYVIETLLKAFPKLQLIFIGMPYRVYSYEGNEVLSDSNDYVSSKGYHRYDYSDAILDNAKANQLPCFDMYRRCGRNKYNIFTICPDGTHPTSDYGQKLTAELYCKILQSF